MEVSIFGLGYVGAVSLACLARDGHKVVGVDIDPVKLDLIRSGKSPVIESGMPELMQAVVESGRVSVTDDVSRALDGSTVSFICVGTPSRSNGSQDQRAVLRLTEELGRCLAKRTGHHTFVYRSTLAPGTVEDTLIPMLEKLSGKREGVDFDVCFQPEFLREGSSIRDYDKPPFTVVGVRRREAAEPLRALFGHLPCEFQSTSVATAETLKYFCNIFHALKITFANEVGRLCQSLSVDPHEVMDLLCADRQLNISPAYLRPGFAFGGSCLPKDLRAIMHIAKGADVELPMLGGIMPSNRLQIDQAVEAVLSRGRPTVGMIGLSFKSGTDDLRESPLVTFAERLLGKGLKLSIYDPEVNISRLIGANRRYIEAAIPHIGSVMTEDSRKLLETSEVVVLGLTDPHLVEQVLKTVKSHQLVVDLVGMTDRAGLNCEYRGVCW